MLSERVRAAYYLFCAVRDRVGAGSVVGDGVPLTALRTAEEILRRAITVELGELEDECPLLGLCESCRDTATTLKALLP